MLGARRRARERSGWSDRERHARQDRRSSSGSSPARATASATLGLGPGEARTWSARTQIGTARGRPATRRESLLYFGQLSDFQLADEESPSRVEFIDYRPVQRRLAAVGGAQPADRRRDDPPAQRASRPRSPVAGGDGIARGRWTSRSTPATRRQPAAQRDRVGADAARGRAARPRQRHRPDRPPTTRSAPPSAPLIADADGAAELHRRPGLRRLRRGRARRSSTTPTSPRGAFADWPQYPGLMDRAQQPFTAAGLDVPVLRHVRQPRRPRPGQRGRERGLRGGRDRLRQADVARRRPTRHASATRSPSLDPANLQSLLLTSDPSSVALVPPDPKRQYVSKEQYKEVFQRRHAGRRPRLRLRRPGRGGGLGRRRRLLLVEPGARLSLHRARHRLRGRRDRAVGRRQHRRPAVPVARGRARGGDEPGRARRPLQPPRDPEPDRRRPRRGRRRRARGTDAHGHDTNPGCDVDPRDSQPRSTSAPTWSSPAASSTPHVDRLGRGPLARQQRSSRTRTRRRRRLLEHPGRRRGRLAAAGPPARGVRQPGRHALDLRHDRRPREPGDRARARRRRGGLRRRRRSPRSAARSPTTTPRPAARACDAAACGEGEADDRNVELLVANPLATSGKGACANRIVGKGGKDTIVGTAGGDRISGRGGKDRIDGRGEADCLHGNGGRDRLRAAPRPTSSAVARAPTGSRAAAGATSTDRVAATTSSAPATAGATRSAAAPAAIASRPTARTRSAAASASSGRSGGAEFRGQGWRSARAAVWAPAVADCQ